MKYSVVKFPAPSLNQPSKPVTVFDDALRTLAQDMNEVMIRENGIGLAAPQIGKNIKLIVVKVGDEGSEYHAYVNPQITFSTVKTTAIEEGCLSLPGVFGFVQRAAKIRYSYQELDGSKKSGKARGMDAIVLQHEIDHISAKLIIDRPFQSTHGETQLEQWRQAKK